MTVRRGKSKRSHEKIGDCAQSKGRKDTENEVVWLSKESWDPQGLQKQKQWRWIAISQPPTHASLLLVLRSVRGARVLRDTSLPISYPQSSNSRLAGGRFKAAKWPVWPQKKKIHECSTCLIYNHNYNKILNFDWLSTALISALIGQFNRTVPVMLK